MDIESFFQDIERQQQKDRKAEQLRDLQIKEMVISIKSSEFNKKVSVVGLAVAILALIVGIIGLFIN